MRRALAKYAIGIYCAHQETIPPGGKVGKIHCALIRELAPLLICSFQPILITQSFARAEAQCHEVNLKLVLTRAKLCRGKFSFAQRRNRTLISGDPQTGD